MSVNPHSGVNGSHLVVGCDCASPSTDCRTEPRCGGCDVCLDMTFPLSTIPDDELVAEYRRRFEREIGR